VPHKFEPRLRKEVLDVSFVSREKIINAKHLIPFFQQPVYQVRTKKACTPSHKDPLPGRVFACQVHFLLVSRVFCLAAVAAALEAAVSNQVYPLH
jgi:hypothetical protein